MNNGDTISDRSLREAFIGFWGEHLRVEPEGEGYLLALPLMDAWGWQVVLHLSPLTPGNWLLSDQGSVLGELEAAGRKTDSGKTREIIDAQCDFYDLEREGLVLRKILSVPFDPAEIQIFAEALVAMSHLRTKVRAEVTVNVERLIEERVGNYFYRHAWTPRRRHSLKGEVEDKIVVDYYLEAERPLALQPVGRHHNLRGYMEQWGWRWMDLKSAHPNLVKAMVFDPDNQQWDAASMRIGEKACDVFTPYTEAEEALDEALGASA